MTDPKKSPPAAPIRAAIYAWFSHADQIGRFPIQAKLRACREFAQWEGWTVAQNVPAVSSIRLVPSRAL